MANDTWRQPALAAGLKDGPQKKRCPRCLATKPVTEFARRKGRTDHQSWCRACTLADSNARARRLVRERRGLPLDAPLMPGYRDPRPEGYTFLNKSGYKMMKASGHPRGDRCGWVFQHIVVAEKKYGFPITRDFTVHHINGDKSDNRPENLDLRIGNHGVGADVIPALLRSPEMRAVARAVLAQYDD